MPMTEDEFYKFEWPVDQSGYEIKRLPVSPPPLFNFDPVTGTALVETDVPHVVACGGPPRPYCPMAEKNRGLWRSFAEQCTSVEGVMAFVRKHGLLSRGPGRLDDIINTAAIIGEIAGPFAAGQLDLAAARFNRFAHGGLTAPVLVRDEKKAQAGRAASSDRASAPWALRFAPHDLFGALFLQVGEAISGNQKFHRCRNERCTAWFRVGRAASTVRREFCSDKCRAASARRRKQKASEAEGAWRDLETEKGRA
jgi:hypothetical protein